KPTGKIGIERSWERFSWGALQTRPAFELSGRGKIFNEAAPDARFKFGAGKRGVQSLSELQQVVSRRQLTLLPESLKQTCPELDVSATTGLPSGPGRAGRIVGCDGAPTLSVE